MFTGRPGRVGSEPVAESGRFGSETVQSGDETSSVDPYALEIAGPVTQAPKRGTMPAADTRLEPSTFWHGKQY
jgi:hypothetical protein